MDRPKTMSVDHIEGGSFVGGDEDAYHFGARGGGPFSVVRDCDIDALMAEIERLSERRTEAIINLNQGLDRAAEEFTRRTLDENTVLLDLLTEILDGSVDASTYPDGPNLDKDLRRRIKGQLDKGTERV